MSPSYRSKVVVNVVARIVEDLVNLHNQPTLRIRQLFEMCPCVWPKILWTLWYVDLKRDFILRQNLLSIPIIRREAVLVEWINPSMKYIHPETNA